MSEASIGRHALFEAGEAAGMVGGACRGNLSAPIMGVCADSRLCAPGSLFVALPGQNLDGSAFARDALNRGASAILADIKHKDRLSSLLVKNEYARACVIYVDDPLAGLQRLAREHRRRHAGLARVGVTGSSGKTTTKECIASILRAHFGPEKVVVSEGNLNSDIGLALSLFSIRAAHMAGVFEMGMNRPGEMDELAFMYEPDLAVITNVGTAHLGMIGSRKGIA
ncbi:MAG TPA: Mur ligase family protein, partial [Rectinemataceae bacterium]